MSHQLVTLYTALYSIQVKTLIHKKDFQHITTPYTESSELLAENINIYVEAWMFSYFSIRSSNLEVVFQLRIVIY